MLGYMTARDAKGYGFTHHGAYYGIPLWVAQEPVFMAATKWAPLEYLMTLFHYIEGFMRSVLFPDSEPGFMFQVGPEIE